MYSCNGYVQSLKIRARFLLHFSLGVHSRGKRIAAPGRWVHAVLGPDHSLCPDRHQRPARSHAPASRRRLQRRGDAVRVQGLPDASALAGITDKVAR